MYFFMTFFASLVALFDASSILCALRHLISRKSKRVVLLNQTEYITPVVQQTDRMKSGQMYSARITRTAVEIATDQLVRRGPAHDAVLVTFL
jgi:hypothetical protein